MNATFRMFEDPHEAKDKKPALEAPKEPSSEQVAMASLLKGALLSCAVSKLLSIVPGAALALAACPPSPRPHRLRRRSNPRG